MIAEAAKAKRDLREKIRRHSAKLPVSYLKEAGNEIARRSMGMPEYLRAEGVLGFVSIYGEPDTREFLLGTLSAGKRLAVPLCTGDGVMEAREIFSLQDLCPGKYGILEPDQRCPVISPEEIQFALIPCVSCTADGKRLGHGGGYYDRYLAGYHGTAALACPEALLWGEIPTEGFDVLIPFVITEHAVYKDGTPLDSDFHLGKGNAGNVCGIRLSGL